MTPEIEVSASDRNWFEVYQSAENYRQREQWQQAIAAYSHANELRGDFFWSYHHLGDALSKQEQWQLAVEAYGKAISIDPQFFWSHHNLGAVLTNLQQWQQAVEAYGKAVKLNSQFFWSWHNLADARVELGRWDLAIANYLQGILLQPEEQISYQKLGTALKQRGTLERSIRDYRRLICSSEAKIWQLLAAQPQQLITLGQNLVRQHQIPAAIVVFYMLLEIQPTNTQIVQDIAQLLSQHQQLEQTIFDNRDRVRQNSSSLLLDWEKAKSDLLSANKPRSGKTIIHHNGAISLNQLNELFISVGWSKRSPEKLKQSLKSSYSYIGAIHLEREQQQLVGFARAVSDGIFHAVLLDIAVHPDFQGNKIGREIVLAIVQQLYSAKISDITLFTSPHMVDFYHKLGFLSQPNNLQWMLWCPTADKL